MSAPIKITYFEDDRKECRKCNIIKSKSEFGKQECRFDGLYPFCSQCLKDENFKYKTSKKGLVYSMHIKIRERTKENYRTPYWRGMEFIDKATFVSFVMLDSNFNKLYDNWVESEFNEKLTPSIDRINSDIGYVLGNLQIITNEENRTKARHKRDENCRLKRLNKVA
jgi:hypothetical protein